MTKLSTPLSGKQTKHCFVNEPFSYTQKVVKHIYAPAYGFVEIYELVTSRIFGTKKIRSFSVK